MRRWLLLLGVVWVSCTCTHAQDAPRALLGQPTAAPPTPLTAPLQAAPSPAAPLPAPLAAPASANLLTLEQFEALALGGNPTIPAAQALVQQEMGFYRQAGLYPNPSVGYVRADPSQSGQSTTQGIFVSQEIVLGGKLQLNRAIEKQEIQTKLWQLDAQKERVLNDVRIQFHETLGAQRLVEAALEVERLAAEAVRLALEAEKAKVGIRPDTLRAELQQQTVRAALQDARIRHLTAWRQLATLVGQPNLPPTPLAPVPDDALPRLTWEDSLSKLLSASPLLQAQQAKIAAARLQYQRARVEPIPNVSLQFVAEHDQVQKFNSLSTFVAVPVPVFNRNQGNVQAAAATIRQEEMEYERIKLALHDQLALSFRQYLNAYHQAERLHKEVLPRVKENLELTRQAHKAGQVSFLRVLDAQQMYFENRLAHIDAVTELRKNAIEIAGLLLTGGLNPTEAGVALQSRGGAGVRGALFGQTQEQGANRTRLLPGALQAGER